MWQKMWPDEKTVVECNLDTLIQWNIHLPEAVVESGHAVWDLMRKRLLLQTGVTTKLKTTRGILELMNLLELHESTEFQVNLIIPYSGTLDYKGLSNIVGYYLQVNTQTGGFLSHIVKLIVENASREHAKAVLFPHIGYFIHPDVESLL